MFLVFHYFILHQLKKSQFTAAGLLDIHKLRSGNLSHAKNWSIWKETIWKLPNPSNKEFTRVLEWKCQHLTVWNLTPRNHPDQEFLRCLFTSCHRNWSSIADKSAEIWERRCGILFSSHLKLLFHLQKRRVCIPSPSAAGYVWNGTAKHFSKFTYSVLCVETSLS